MKNENLSTNDLSVVLQITKTYLSLTLNRAEFEQYVERKGHNLIVDLENILINLKFNSFLFDFEKNDNSKFIDRLKIQNKKIINQFDYLTTSQLKKYVIDISHYDLRVLRDNGIIKYEYREEEHSKDRYFYETNSLVEHFNSFHNTKLNDYSIFPTKQFYTIEEYLETHDISIYKLRKKMREDEIPSIKIGTIYRIPILESSELETYHRNIKEKSDKEKKDLLTPTHEKEDITSSEKKKYQTKRRSFNNWRK